jgi:hypothetical protein
VGLSSFIPYESFFIQAHYQHGHLIAEQNPDERNPLFQPGIETTHTSQLEQ